MVATIDIAGRKVGLEHPCFVIAEAGVNHDGNLDAALRLVDVAAEAGADAVKFQTLNAIQMVSPNAPKAKYQLRNTDSNESQFEMLRRLELTPQMHEALSRRSEERGIIFLSTAFDEVSADYLGQLGVAAFKIPSGEITNLSYLTHIAEKHKPLIVSTGMANLGEVEAAVQAIERAGNRNYVLLHCVSNYPADPRDVNLRAMQTMHRAFQVPVGYSDHTTGIDVAVASVALGACVLEKHFTLDRQLPGPDHKASLEPDELSALVRAIRTVESALGHGRKSAAASERNTAEVARKSLVAAEDIAAGTVLTEKLIAIRRPGTGLPPVMKPHVVNRTARESIPAGALIELEKVA